MHTLSTLFPAAFPALALSHFVALLSPGPDFFLLVGYAVRYRIRGSIGLCLGIAAGNALYIVLAIVGWGFCARRRCFCSSSCWGGLFIVDWQPADTQPSRNAGGGERSRSASGVRQAAAARAGIIAAQPQNALFYLALMTSLLGPAVTLLQQTVSGLWMVSVVFFWDLLLVSAIALPQIQRRLAPSSGGSSGRRGDPDALRHGDYLAILHDLAVRLYA
nr:threonine efflux system [Klebsiella pneumoniae]